MVQTLSGTTGLGRNGWRLPVSSWLTVLMAQGVMSRLGVDAKDQDRHSRTALTQLSL